MKQKLGEQLERLEAYEEARSTYIKSTLERLHLNRSSLQESSSRAIKALLASAEQINPPTDLLQYIEQVEVTAWSRFQEGAAGGENTEMLRAAPPSIGYLDRR